MSIITLNLIIPNCAEWRKAVKNVREAIENNEETDWNLVREVLAQDDVEAQILNAIYDLAVIEAKK